MSERPERLAAYDLTCLDLTCLRHGVGEACGASDANVYVACSPFSTVWLELLVQRYMPVTGLRIAMREMPASAKFATVHP